VVVVRKKPALRAWSNFCAEPIPRRRIQSFAPCWPGGSLGVALRYAGVIALDVDTEDAGQLAAIREAIPPSPIAKTGAEGFTTFCRAAPGASSPPSRHYAGTAIQPNRRCAS